MSKFTLSVSGETVEELRQSLYELIEQLAADGERPQTREEDEELPEDTEGTPRTQSRAENTRHEPAPAGHGFKPRGQQQQALRPGQEGARKKQ